MTAQIEDAAEEVAARCLGRCNDGTIGGCGSTCVRPVGHDGVHRGQTGRCWGDPSLAAAAFDAVSPSETAAKNHQGPRDA